jgi:class 3 adenylate cyclase
LQPCRKVRRLADNPSLLRQPGSSCWPPSPHWQRRRRDLAAAKTSAEPVADVAERRQVTVLFSDLVGSTALSTRMDPEDLRKLISAYQKCVTETVRRFGGFVAKYMGDGVLVYFGYQEAHEDDAERAVRSGLELVAAVRKLKMGTPLQTRVGIATGLVVVGDLVGSGHQGQGDRRRTALGPQATMTCLGPGDRLEIQLSPVHLDRQAICV